MNKRLLEMQDYGSQDEAEAARLLATLTPAAPSETAERRVYASVCVRRSAGPRFVRAAVLVGVLLISTTILSATLAPRWFFGRSVGQAGRATQPPRTTELTSAKEVAPPSPFPAAERNAAPASAVRTDAHRDRSGIPTAARRRALSAINARNPGEEAIPVEETTATPPPEEAALVMMAVRALRREHDPVQAGALLDGYLRRFPQGVLTEEALAVGIEAAVARQDSQTAKALAERYLRRYPSGRFASLARKASGMAKP